ncbi:uncharacterized protein K452DRAFT_340954 [Aplosporella prunicola CBS 121167]|uniref:Uncharacterized protein n=1 Tax=Aplosporella prunicola CBS 121167 TaxID=1176127 RepID=A0A6A6BS63_9PEZI|nr:uncharacterized protein K452DRAFT_340954 [Aplosporella prunicola CBS 121167]KAF2146313.1 hypothetical protein K452DRAFT_340954 [Aplosporella prunicola CBS 121167]
MIYRYALCPREGIVITPLKHPKSISRQDPERFLFKCVHPVASGLLRVNRHVSSIAVAILYGENVFSFEAHKRMHVEIFLQNLPEQSRLRIRHLCLGINSVDFPDTELPHIGLEKYILENMQLEGLTLPTPNDWNADGEWWRVQEIFMKAFRTGRFKYLRLTSLTSPYIDGSYRLLNGSEDPLIYALSMSLFHDVEEAELLFDRLCEDSEQCEKFPELGRLCHSCTDSLTKFTSDLVRRAGFTLEEDELRPEETSMAKQAYILQRLTPQKRGAQDSEPRESKRLRQSSPTEAEEQV